METRNQYRHTALIIAAVMGTFCIAPACSKVFLFDDTVIFHSDPEDVRPDSIRCAVSVIDGVSDRWGEVVDEATLSLRVATGEDLLYEATYEIDGELPGSIHNMRKGLDYPLDCSFNMDEGMHKVRGTLSDGLSERPFEMSYEVVSCPDGYKPVSYRMALTDGIINSDGSIRVKAVAAIRVTGGGSSLYTVKYSFDGGHTEAIDDVRPGQDCIFNCTKHMAEGVHTIRGTVSDAAHSRDFMASYVVRRDVLSEN